LKQVICYVSFVTVVNDRPVRLCNQTMKRIETPGSAGKRSSMRRSTYTHITVTHTHRACPLGLI